jgi:hypothetical protein
VSTRLKSPAYAEALAGKPAYGASQPSAGKQNLKQDGHAWLDFSGKFFEAFQ